MQKFIVTGGTPLNGEVRIAGAKNAVLKLMAAAVLTDEPATLRNVPKISDVMIMRETMSDIGFEVTRINGDALQITAGDADWPFVPLEAAMKMRSSFILLGPMLTRFGRVIISNPGGDRIGRRPGGPARRRHAATGSRDRVQERLLLRQCARRPAWRADRVSVRHRDGHRERPAGCGAGPRHLRDRERGAGAGDRRPGGDAVRHGRAASSAPRHIGSRSRASTGWPAWNTRSWATGWRPARLRSPPR